jgi:hypothetical protein
MDVDRMLQIRKDGKEFKSSSKSYLDCIINFRCFGRAPHVISPWITDFLLHPKVATGGVVAMWILEVTH